MTAMGVGVKAHTCKSEKPQRQQQKGFERPSRLEGNGRFGDSQTLQRRRRLAAPAGG